MGSISTFRLLVLGPFSLFENGTSLDPGTWPPRAQSLFKLIATAPEHRRPRDEIIDLLWPEATVEAGAANLRYTLHLLRRLLGGRDPSPILFEKHLVALNRAYLWEVDLDQFEALVRTAGHEVGNLERAAQIYRGEPLIEDRYADWAIPVRERAQLLWRDLCVRLAAIHRAGGASSEVLRWYERMLESDPLDEEAMLGIVETLRAVNRSGEAARRYTEFAERLQLEIGVAPGPELQAAATRFQGHLATPTPRVERQGHGLSAGLQPVIPSYDLMASGTLVGREEELGDILAALPDAGMRDEGREQPTRLLLIAGEAGMGKTRLLAEVAERSRAMGFLTLAGGCYEIEGRLPYGPIHDALLDYIRVQPAPVLATHLGGLEDDLGRIIPGLQSGGAGNHVSRNAETERTRLFSTVAEVLERISWARPLVLLLDDLQWADEATLQLLHYLSRRIQGNRLMIVGAYRTPEPAACAAPNTFFENVEESGHVRVLRLDALSEAQMAVLLAERLGGESDLHLVRVLQERGAGNPFFALQMARLLKESGRLVRGLAGWTIADGTQFELPPAVQQAIARRLRGLGPDEREVLSLGAVLGREFPYAPLEAMWEGDERSLFQTLDTTVNAYLVHEIESGYAFSHPLLWEVVYRCIPAARRELLHERAGLGLEALYGETAFEHAPELAHHFRNAGQVHRARTARYLTLAGDAARRGYAWTEALAAYTSALEFAEDAAATAGLQESRGDVLKALTRFDEAIEALEHAAAAYREVDDPEGEGRTAVLLALTHHFRHSRWEEAGKLHGAVQRLEARGASPATLARLNAAVTRVHLLSDNAAAGLASADRAVAHALATGDGRLIADAHLVRGRSLNQLGRWDEAIVAFTQARQLAEAAGDLFTAAASLDLTGGAYVWSGNLVEAAAYFDRALALEEQRGGLELIESTLHSAADVRLFLGRWEEARALVNRGLTLPGTRSPMWIAPMETLNATLALYMGDWHGIPNDVEGRPEYEQIRLSALLAEMHLLTGNPLEALGYLEPFVGVPRASQDLRFLITLAWAYLEAGNPAETENTLASAERAAKQRRSYVPDVLRIRGMLLARQGRRAEAREALDLAACRARAMFYPYSEARALYEWGRTLAGERETCAARDRLEGALRIFSRLRARPYVERTAAELRETTSN